jgi:hypothetical protein
MPCSVGHQEKLTDARAVEEKWNDRHAVSFFLKTRVFERPYQSTDVAREIKVLRFS